MEYPTHLQYTKTHEWIRLEGDIATVGITDYAQDALGDVVFVELPSLKAVVVGESVAVVESVKTASDIYAPLAGTVIEVNADLKDTPELLNSSPYGSGWMFRMQVTSTEGLVSAADYQASVEASL
jgi:glycine cleavage system H protein